MSTRKTMSLVKAIARRIWSRLDLIGSSGQDCEHTVERVLEEAKRIRAHQRRQKKGKK